MNFQTVPRQMMICRGTVFFRDKCEYLCYNIFVCFMEGEVE
mgnify:CR=1 FL=1